MSFTLKTLTEGIRDRHVGQQNKRLVEKWSRTGLLRGMEDVNRENMATMLENQAAQVLRESNLMSSGDVGGFTNIAFPIVRRVFGGLIANELVSIQPMSLPSGLLFYLDYTYGSDGNGYNSGESVYGGPAGKAIQGGADATGGQYDLVGTSFSRVRIKAKDTSGAAEQTLPVDASARPNIAALDANELHLLTTELGASNAETDSALSSTKSLKVTSSHDLSLIQHDPQIIDRINAGSNYIALLVHPNLTDTDALDTLATKLDPEYFREISLVGTSGTDDKDVGDQLVVPPDAVQSSAHVAGGGSGTKEVAFNVKRLNQIGSYTNNVFTPDPLVDVTSASARILFIVEKAVAAATAPVNLSNIKMSYVEVDTVGFAGGEATGSPSFESNMKPAGDEISPVIPEIDIKIESIPVTAQTRKLRARWSPELAQDLNAYHSMDAEVELTQILSEQIALEIDREILGDLLNGAKGANFFWSRSPGKFVNKRTGAEIARTSSLNPGPAFTGTVREWYETLTETVIDVANEIHRKTLRGSANFIVVSPDVATILEASVLYRPSYSLDGDGQVGAPFTMGAEKVGTLSNRFTVYKDPYFPRNKILVGYKGGSYLETGFVYAPYVPLIVTPTIFAPEDFTPRKGVMTRYGKKMVRADFYGTVTCLDMNII